MVFRVGVIIVSAGIGRRLGKIDKAVIEIEGKPLFYHTWQAFSGLNEISQIVVVLRKKNFPVARKIISRKTIIVEGGKFRSDSVRRGLQALSKDITHVLIHDGARPFVSGNVIRRVIKELKKSPAVICGIKAKDTVKLVKGGMVTGTIDRNDVFFAHTPQGFRRDIIVNAYSGAKKLDFFDDAQITESAGIPVKTVPDEERNFKITYPADLRMAQAVMAGGLRDYRVGLGFDVHRFTSEKRGIMLACVKIPSPVGIDAVSDGDVLLHALADGICGACSLGDIGDYFPPEAGESKGIKSTEILQAILGKIKNRFTVINIDATVISEKPKLSPYKIKMTKSLQKLFPRTAVNVKIKSKEGLEILGGTQAIACLANVLVKPV